MATLDIVIRAQNQASAALNQLQRQLGGIEREANVAQRGFSGLQRVVGGAVVAASAAAATALVGVGAAITKISVDGVRMAADLEAQISSIAAVMGETADAVQPLKDLILDLGLDPNLKVSAVEAANAIEMLARNGLKMDEILGGAAHSTVLLANATGAQFSTAADIATDVMAQFKISAADMNTAVNGITSVVTNSKFSIDDYGLAIAQAGGVASSSGVDFEDFNTSIAAIAPLFASGSDAGTSFKTFLQRLAPSTDTAVDAMRSLGLYTGLTSSEFEKTQDKIAKYRKDLEDLDPASKSYAKRAGELTEKISILESSLVTGQNAFFDMNGSMRGMDEISVILNKSLSGLSEEQRNLAMQAIFGTDSMRAAVGLMESGAVVYTDVAKAAAELGVSQAKVNEYIGGGITQFEALQITMSKTDALEAAKLRMDNLKGSIEILQGVIDTIKIQIGDALIPIVRSMTEAFTNFLTANSHDIIKFFQNFVYVLPIAAGVVRDLFDAMSWMLTGQGWNIDWWYDITNGLVEITGGMLISQQQADKLAEMLFDIGAASSAILQPIGNLVSRFFSWRDVLAAIGVVIASIAIPALGGVVTAVAPVLAVATALVASMALLRNAWEQNWGNIQGVTDTAIGGISAAFDALWTAISTGDTTKLEALWNSIKSWIIGVAQKLPPQLAEWATSFTKWTSGIWTKLSANLATVWTSLTTWIDSKVDLLYPYLYKWATEFWAWATEVWTDLDTNLATMWESLTTWIDGKVDVLYTYLYKWATEFWAWAGEVWAELSPKLVTMFESITGWIAEQAVALPTKLAAWATAFVDWASKAWTDVQPKLTEYSTSLKSWADEQGPALEQATKSWTKALSNWVPKDNQSLIKPLGESLSKGILGLQETVGTAIGYMIGAAFGGAIRFVANAVAIFVTGIIGSINMAFNSEDNKSSASEGLGSLISGMFANIGKSLGAIGVGFRDQLQATFDDAIMGIRDEEWAKLTANMSMVWSNMVNGVTGAATDLRNSLTMSFLTLKISVSNHIESMYNDAVFRLALMAYKAGSLAGEAKDAVIGKFNELAGAAGTAIDALRSTVESKFGGIKTWIEGLSIGNPFSAVVGWANSAVSAVQNAWNVINGGGGSGAKHAAGTPYFRGGLTTINERGTELLALPGRNRNVWLPRGTSIIPSERVPMMAGAGGGVTVNLYATINNDMDVESITWQVAAELRRNQR